MTIQTMRDFGIGEGQLYIGGRWVDSASRDRREIENPKDESIVALVPSITIEDADRAVAAARKAQPSGADERRWSAARCFRNLRI